MDHFNQFFFAICAGLGLFLAGAANLVLIRKSLSLRVIATVLAVGIALAAAEAIDQPGTVAGTATLLACCLPPVFVLGNRRFISFATTAIAATSRPVVRFGLLTIAGIGTAIGSTVYFEHVDDKATTIDLAEIEMIQGRQPTAPSERARATTDRGAPIVLREVIEARETQTLTEAEARLLSNNQLNLQVIRTSSADDHANCHGWVFTGGRYVLSGEDVGLIVSDNSYGEISDPRPGDLVVYRGDGQIVHTAIVQYVTKGQPVLVQSKWGNLGVFFHAIDKSPYGMEYKYYRSDRRGHLLAGIGGPPVSESSASNVVE
jgi:hypothetical protein